MKIDINDLNFFSYSKDMKLTYAEERYKINIWRVLKAWLIILFKGFASIGYFFIPAYKPKDLKIEIALFGFSLNNTKSLGPLSERLPNSKFFTPENLSLKRAWFYTMIYSPIVIYRCFTYSGLEKQFYCYYFTSFCKSFGTYIEAKRILKDLEPKLVVFSNDHSYTPRCFFRAAQSLKIKTAYLQHASVGEHFPPLEFDYSFLDGIESYEKYTNGKECKSVVFLSGNPRFDFLSKLSDIVSHRNTRKIGIALNSRDNYTYVKRLIHLIKLEISDVLIDIRPHPSSNMALWADRAHELGCTFSNSLIVNPFVFIQNNSLFISGNCSIHLDVIMSEKMSFFYNFSDDTLDAYLYLKNELIEDITLNPIANLKNALSHEGQFISKKAQYYVANYNTPHWQKSAELISATILEILHDKPIDANWQKSTTDDLYLIRE